MPGSFSDFKGDVWNLMSVLRWIKDNVPCFVGQIPAEWTQRVYAEAALHGIEHTVAQAAMATGWRYGYRFDFTERSVVNMSAADKLGAAIGYSVPYLPETLQSAVLQLASPTSLAIMAGTLVLWAGSHAIGIGEIADVILLGIGFATAGFSIFHGAEAIGNFVTGALGARTTADLRAAGEQLAVGVTLLGIGIIQTLLLRTQLKNFRAIGAERFRAGPSPPRGTRPQIYRRPSLPPTKDGRIRLGATDVYGNIWISLAQTLEEQSLALFHELVHRFFSPLGGRLARLRADMSFHMYERSAFLRYLEEGLAEGVAQLRKNGFWSGFKGIWFPFTNGYISVSEVLTGGNLIGTITLAGRRFYVLFTTKELPDALTGEAPGAAGAN